MLLKAFLKFTNCTAKGLWFSVHCSRTLRTVKFRSVHDLPALNPACSFRSLKSTAFFSLCSSILGKIFPWTHDKVIPRQLLQSDASPSFGSFTITPYCHSFGTSCFLQQLLSSSVNLVTRSSPPCLGISPIISSQPTALLFLSAITASTVSSLVISLVLNSKWWCLSFIGKIKSRC